MTKKPPNITDITQISFTPIMRQIVDFLKISGEEFTVQLITERLNLKYNTVRAYLRKLTKAKAVKCQTLGGINFYSFPIAIPTLKHEPPELKFHGITLLFKHQGKQWFSFQKRWRREIFLKPTHSSEISAVEPLGSTRPKPGYIGLVYFQNGKENLEVQYGGTGRPLTWEEFQGWLRWLGREYHCDPFTDPRWEVRQCGLGSDFEKSVLEGFQGSLSVQNFLGEVCRIYDKTLDSGEEVVRVEMHTQPNITVANFWDALKGGMTSAYIMQLVGRQTVVGERNSALQQIIIKKLERVAELLVELLNRRNGV